jgi:alpha-2-macroglobulin
MTFTVEQNGQKTNLKDMKSVVYNQQLKVEDETVSITNHGENPFFVNVSTSGIPRRGSVVDLEKGLRLETLFYDDNNKPLNVEALKQGTQIKVVTRVTNLSGRSIDHLALNQLIPAGWELVNARLEKETNQANNFYDFQDIRDDRILTYFRLDHNNTVVFTFTAIAAYEGKFQMPAMQCEDMYDREIMVVRGEKVVKVIQNR